MFWKEWVIKRETHQGTGRIPIFVFISVSFFVGAYGYTKNILNPILSMRPGTLSSV